MAMVDKNSKVEYRIYKPLFLKKDLDKKDLDREFESISQSLIWVTLQLDSLKAPAITDLTNKVNKLITDVSALTSRVAALEAAHP